MKERAAPAGLVLDNPSFVGPDVTVTSRDARHRMSPSRHQGRQTMRDYAVISTDDHIIEPPGIFDGRLPKEFADRTPKLVETDAEAAWHVPGIERPIAMSGLSSAAGQKETEFSPKSKTFDAMRKGCYDPRERIKDMDIDGVDAQVTFPTLPGLAGAAFIEI